MLCNKLLLVLFTTQLKYAVLESTPQVHIEQGILQGTYLTSSNGRKYAAFQGVPYASPPIGKFRFKDPAPPKPWVGIWNASEPGSACLQNMEIPTYFKYTNEHYTPHIQTPIAGDEDCLFINIYTPQLPTNTAHDKLLDVIVFIHGGCFMHGHGSWYGPRHIMDRDVLFVNFNYRLGPLGFLSTDDEVVPGNMGLKDQSAALHWIQKNIAAFGGNPNSVTITGNSAGGASVHFHYLSPMSKGTFHRGISLSGSALCPWALMEDEKAKVQKLAAALGCTTESSKQMIKCLRKRPAYKIVQQIKNFKGWLHSPFSPFGPVVEKTGSTPFLNKHPKDVILDGEAQNLPWIASVDKEEGIYPVGDFIANKDLLQELEDRFEEVAPYLLHYNDTVHKNKKKEVADKIRTFYLKEKPVSPETATEIIKLTGDRLFTADIERAARMHAAVYAAPVYFYVFGYRGKHSVSEWMTGKTTNFGVSHGDDVGYTIDCEFNNIEESEADKTMSNIMLDIWASYASTGNPNPEGKEFTWDRVNQDSKELNYLYIKDINNINMKIGSDLGKRRFWDSLPIEENQFNVDDTIVKRSHTEL